jgi:hypothetical protein
MNAIHPPTQPRHGRATTLRLALCVALLGLMAAATLWSVDDSEYRKRQEALDADQAQEHYALGLWAIEQKLTTEAREEFEHALQLNPACREAAAKLAEITGSSRRVRNPKCEFLMVGGEKLKAELLMSSFRVLTSGGFLVIPTAEMDLVELNGGPGDDKLISDSYVGEGRLKAETFSAQSMVGPITVKRIDVKSIRIFRPCPDCDGAGQIACRRCGGTGKLTERSVCPDCGGKGRIKCATCNGQKTIACPLCGGRGRISGSWGRQRWTACPRCQGAGKVDCPDCDDGTVVCPTCKGKPQSAKAGPCPVCNGAKTTPCATCGGTGVRALPKIETPEEPKPETPAPDAKPAETVEP